MSLAWLVLLAAAGSTTAGVPDSGESLPPPNRIVSFVGEQVALERIDCIRLVEPSDDPEYVDDDGVPYDARCGEDDIHVRARYRVVLPLEGADGEEYEFFATGWTDYYAPGRWALLYLRETDDGWIMPSGLGAAVWPTVDGGWAACDEYHHKEPVEFADDLVFARTDGLSPYGVKEQFPAEDFEVVGNRVHCLRGENLPALVDRLESELDEGRESGFGELDLQATRP